jgi:hypothetical protein
MSQTAVLPDPSLRLKRQLTLVFVQQGHGLTLLLEPGLFKTNVNN